jgi:hypothetical protein
LDLPRNPEEVSRAFTCKLAFDLMQPADDAIDGFVSEIFGFAVSATGEKLDQSGANPFVFDPCLVTVGVKPLKQPLKRFLRHDPVLMH